MVLSLPQCVTSAQSLEGCKLGILKPSKSKTTHIWSLLAAHNRCDMVAIHQLARSVQGVKLLNNSGSSVGPLVAAVESVISCVGAPLSVFARPHWCQDLRPKNLPKKLAKCFTLLALSSGPVLWKPYRVAGLAPQTCQHSPTSK